MVPEQLQVTQQHHKRNYMSMHSIIYFMGLSCQFHRAQLFEREPSAASKKIGALEYLVLYGMFIEYNVVLSASVCRWDEWVPECRVLKYNEQNLTKQQDLKRQYDRYGSFVFLTCRLYSI